MAAEPSFKGEVFYSKMHISHICRTFGGEGTELS